MKAGLGIRPELFEPVLAQQPDLGFLEAHSENYFQPSVARAKLMELRENYPISLHGVGLSLGRADALDQNHLAELKKLADNIEPILISEHLAWSAYSHRHLPDLLPLPLTEEAFQIICAHISQMQDHLQRQILLENPSNYLLFDQLQVGEPEFLNAVAAQTGCGLLLDINNIHVSASNLGRDAKRYLAEIDTQHVKQYHLAGYMEMQVAEQAVLIDTHNQTVYPPVWELYELALKTHGRRPTLFEWDSDFPEFEVLLGEVAKANEAQAACLAMAPLKPKQPADIQWPPSSQNQAALNELQSTFLDQVLDQSQQLEQAISSHRDRIWVYQNNTYGAIQDYLAEVFPATMGVVGEPFFRQMCAYHVQTQPPEKGNIYYFGEHFADVVSAFEGLAAMPYLADLIALEWAIHNAYFADLADQLDPSQYAQEALLQLPVSFNQSVWQHQSDYPIWEIYHQSLPEYNGEVNIDLGQSRDYLLVFKRGYLVETQVLSDEHSLFLQNLANSENLLQAIEQVSGSISTQEISSALALTFELELLRSNEI